MQTYYKSLNFNPCKIVVRTQNVLRTLSITFLDTIKKSIVSLLSYLNKQSVKKRFENSFLYSNLDLILFESISGISVYLDISVISRPFKPNKDSKDVKRDTPLFALPIAIKGLLNMIENTQAWKESVTTNSAS